MRTRNMLLVAMLVALYGCQPETPAQSPAEPAMEPPAAAPAEPATSPAMTPAPEQQAEPAQTEKKPAPAMEQKPAAAKVNPPAAVMENPAPAMAAPVMPAAKGEPAQMIAEAKPAAVLSETDALALAKKNGCLVCHAVDKKVVGPAWKDVANKYRGDAGAEARMMDKIAKGGSGVWGSIAMPPNPRLSEADRRTLAKFVLSLK